MLQPGEYCGLGSALVLAYIKLSIRRGLSSCSWQSKCHDTSATPLSISKSVVTSVVEALSIYRVGLPHCVKIANTQPAIMTTSMFFVNTCNN
jgi:hypothetical protein